MYAHRARTYFSTVASLRSAPRSQRAYSPAKPANSFFDDITSPPGLKSYVYFTLFFAQNTDAWLFDFLLDKFAVLLYPFISNISPLRANLIHRSVLK